MAGLPPGINLADDNQSQIIGSVSATWALATIALTLRFICRRISKAGFWWDDYLMVPAYVFTSISSWISITWMINFGLGKHIFVQPLARIPECVEVFLKSLFITEVCYTGTIVFAKFSILAFYWRLFSRNDFVRWAVIVITGMVTMWGIAVFLIVVTQCRPLHGFWDKTIPAVCSVDSYKFFYGNSVPNIITDALLILTPLPAIWALRLQLQQKISLSGIFLLGIFVTGVSITRLIYLVSLDVTAQDVTWVFRMPQIWTCVELNIAVVCGCLPQLRPLMLLITTGSAIGTSAAASTNRKTANTGASTKRSFFSKSGASAMDTAVESNIGAAPSPDPGEKKFGDTRPLVGVPQQGLNKSAGYIELGNMETGHGHQHRESKGAVWVRTEWDVTTSSKSQASSGRSSKEHVNTV
ncbi:hypothetical protein K505DRAFT_309506 [Melanomma pulvis-pyrius CBS 109.77]|uniref:Rhodopsin domain-containing protein n=1 Tax=Melanomma pulvis-pyrius CBS 109.77 TaxID=1314802 RepID=A0A6A6X4J2_9PLEO|nr:hypothetical protein K505DRAFT_309506 [Melanomma pulvis-pyrius CBS 109.77]